MARSPELPLEAPKVVEGQAELDSWSRMHAVAMVGATVASIVLGRAWPTAAMALLSFAVLVLRGRRAWGSVRRTVVPNLVTALRVLIIASMTFALHDAPGLLVTAVMLGVLALDALDGWLARRANAVTAFGAHFDMETDAFFILTVDLELLMRGRLGFWILITGFLRYAYMLVTALVPPRGGQVPRSRLGRNSFGCLVVGLSAAMASTTVLGTAAAALGTSAVVLSFGWAFYWSYLRRHQGPLAGVE
jgi:phosphatidylglycerophosphate synthase